MSAEPAHQPVTADEADIAFACLARFETLLLAISGGPDSLALLYLVAEWAKRSGRPAPALHAATVDHQLRAQSATEAALVADHCARLGVPHTILNWDGPKPPSGVMEEARRARYQRLGDHVSAIASVAPAAVVTAHTMDDQAETLVMRLKRGSGVEGMAGIPFERAFADNLDVRLVRPLLAFEKSRLIATLQVRGQTWCDDPTNTDAHYERVRVRGLMQTLQQSGVTPEALARTARRMRDAASGLDYALGQFKSTLALDLHRGMFATLGRRAFDCGPAILRQRMVRDLIARFGGTTPAPEALEIETAAARIAASPETRLTLGGATLSAGPKFIRVWREPGRISSDSIAMEPGNTVLWDGRFWVSYNQNGDTGERVIVVRPLGAGGFGTIAAVVKDREELPAAAAHGLPAFWAGQTLLAVPALGVLTDAGKSLAGLRLTCDPFHAAALDK